MMQKEGYLDFDEYLVASEPHKRERAEAWKVAILKHTARRHIEGEITIDEARELTSISLYSFSETC